VDPNRGVAYCCSGISYMLGTTPAAADQLATEFDPLARLLLNSGH